MQQSANYKLQRILDINSDIILASNRGSYMSAHVLLNLLNKLGR